LPPNLVDIAKNFAFGMADTARLLNPFIPFPEQSDESDGRNAAADVSTHPAVDVTKSIAKDYIPAAIPFVNAPPKYDPGTGRLIPAINGPIDTSKLMPPLIPTPEMTLPDLFTADHLPPYVVAADSPRWIKEKTAKLLNWVDQFKQTAHDKEEFLKSTMSSYANKFADDSGFSATDMFKKFFAESQLAKEMESYGVKLNKDGTPQLDAGIVIQRLSHGLSSPAVGSMLQTAGNLKQAVEKLNPDELQNELFTMQNAANQGPDVVLKLFGLH